MPSGDVPCTLASADTQNRLECNAALSDTQPKLPSQDLPSAASNNNDVLSNPLSNINGVLNALNPNPIYVPNVQNSAACDTLSPSNCSQHGRKLRSETLSLHPFGDIRNAEEPEVSGNGVSHEPGDVSWPTYKWNMVVTRCTRRQLCLAAVYTTTVLVSCVVIGVFLWLTLSANSTTVAALYPCSQQSPTPHNAKLLRNGGMTSAVETVTLQEMGGPLSVTLTVPGRVALRATGVGTLQLTVTVLAVSIIITQVESGDRKLENIITIGGDGKEPIIREAYGVAVSADNEIFVTGFNKVQVFSIKGNYLRLFQTIMPGENVFIVPVDLAIGIEPGHLWVVGPIFNSGAHEGHVQVVKYSRIGQIMKKFDLGFTKHYIPPVIAVDVRNNKIIIGQGSTVKIFYPDGSLYRSFKASSGSFEEGMIGGVISDTDGNILLTFFKSAFKAVAMYSHYGVKIVEFAGRNKGQLYYFYGISRDKLGNIIVADNENNRVDMFTSRGKFVRTIANIQDPYGIAMGPDGEMVVTTTGSPSTVTIFPHHKVLH
ncbi:hypothetical protein Bbelb_309610 [Branchiostoma belcheri]|nr:hypothetical protein Bbelb_309610 [Branchiostoma belcheri]